MKTTNHHNEKSLFVRILASLGYRLYSEQEMNSRMEEFKASFYEDYLRPVIEERDALGIKVAKLEKSVADTKRKLATTRSGKSQLKKARNEAIAKNKALTAENETCLDLGSVNSFVDI